jgi:hypothetical protein
MLDDDDAPLYPLIDYTAGIVEGAIALRFEFATCRQDYASGEGEHQQFVMSPEAAIEIGSALIEQARVAKQGSALV